MSVKVPLQDENPGLTVHATVVSFGGRGVLIRGASGTGKSSLALEMMARGARLVADDRVRLSRRGDEVIASAPPQTAGLIEARGIGILHVAAVSHVPVAIVVDLDRVARSRLPPAGNTSLCGVDLPLVEGIAGPHLAISLCVMAMGRRIDPDAESAGAEWVKAGFRTGTQVEDFGSDRQLAQTPGGAQRIVLVTGPSGAGRSTAINVLEDLGFEAIDNLPLSLIPRLLDGPPRPAPLALGLDVRNRDFSASNVIEMIDEMTRNPAYAAEVLYLDCADDTLIRRYSETRRPHPLAAGSSPTEAVQMERDLLAPIRVRADVLMDTTELSPHDLRAELGRFFDLRGSNSRLAVSVQSFSYKRGVPRGMDMMFDCRFLANPHWVSDLRAKDGRDEAVQTYVEADPRYDEFFDRVRDLILFLLPAHSDEGKSHLAIGFGCTGGQHRSVTLAENMADALAEAGWQVSKRHRELERRDSAPRVADTAQQTQPALSDPGHAPPSEH